MLRIPTNRFLRSRIRRSITVPERQDSFRSIVFPLPFKRYRGCYVPAAAPYAYHCRSHPLPLCPVLSSSSVTDRFCTRFLKPPWAAASSGPIVFQAGSVCVPYRRGCLQEFLISLPGRILGMKGSVMYFAAIIII